MHRRGLPALALALLPALAGALLATATGALAVSARVHASVEGEAGGVKAVLAYERVLPPGGSAGTEAESLTITRAGLTVFDAAVVSPSCTPCSLDSFPAEPPLAVTDLEGAGEPDVVLHLYTGGAHCCTIVQVFSYSAATGTYRRAERDFGDPGALIEQMGDSGPPDLVSADDRFAYEFAPYAYSGLPLQIFAFRAGRFLDVTRSFPAALGADADKWLRAFRAGRRHRLGNGPIAAWAADEELLAHDALVRSTLGREARHGRLRSRQHYGPSGSRFVRALMRFLARTGYRR